MPAPAQTPRIQELLTLAEDRSRVLSAALLEGQADRVALASSDLQQVVEVLSGSLRQPAWRASLDGPAASRLRRLGQDLVQQREACLRRSALVDRALNSLLPSTRSTTYGGGTTPYGQQARRSGAFKLISA